MEETAPLELPAWLLLDRRTGKAHERRFVVEVGEGPDLGQRWELAGRIQVGTGTECGIRLTDTTVSRQHLDLEVVPEGVWVRDLQSKNGTYLREVRVESVLVGDQAALRVGKTQLVLRAVTRPLAAATRTRFGDALGTGPAMQALFALLERAAPSDAPVLLLGETGTGKEVLAQALHRASPRAQGPFVVVDCASLSPTLAESELFGHARGAFTGADQRRAGAFLSASGGTIFLDELGELPLELQTKLLRVLETRKVKPLGEDALREVNARVIAATHRSLPDEVTAGRFRRDLYFRLAVVVAHVPPLRERLEDLPLLVERFENELGGARFPIPDALLSQLRAYGWPGNVRELRNVVHRAILGDDQPLTPLGGSPPAVPAAEALSQLSFKEAKERLVETFARDYLRALLERHGGNLSAVARASGLNRNHVRRLAVRYGLIVEDGGAE